MTSTITGPVEVNITDTAKNVHSVMVLPAPYARSKLVLELTKENMDLLTKSPDAAEALEFRPTVNASHVTYLPYRKAIKTSFIDPKTGRTRTKTLCVKANTPQDMQDRVDKLEGVLEEWWAVNSPNGSGAASSGKA